MDKPAIEMVSVVAMGYTHGIGFLQMVEGGVECDLEDISINGRLDKKHLLHTSPEMVKAFTPGIRFTIIHRKVFEVVPDLFDVLVSAWNNQSHSEETEFEGLLGMAAGRKSYEEKDEPVDWAAIQASAVGSQPIWSPWVSALTDLAKLMPSDQVEELCSLNKVLRKCKDTDSVVASH